MTSIEKPVLGLIPKNIADNRRTCDILEAMLRYTEAYKPIPAEWLSELNELNKHKGL